jgi:hypothetical protein
LGTRTHLASGPATQKALHDGGRDRGEQADAVDAVVAQGLDLAGASRVLFVLDGTGAAGADNRIRALRAGTGQLAPSRFLHDVPFLAAPLADLLRHGPSAPVWRPVHDPDRPVH